MIYYFCKIFKETKKTKQTKQTKQNKQNKQNMKYSLPILIANCLILSIGFAFLLSGCILVYGCTQKCPSTVDIFLNFINISIFM